jgi:hypothetical protein
MLSMFPNLNPRTHYSCQKKRRSQLSNNKGGKARLDKGKKERKKKTPRDQYEATNG